MFHASPFQEGSVEKIQDLKSFEGAIYRKYMLAVCAFGFLFPLGAISVDLIYQGITPSLTGIINLHLTNPLYFVIDTAPFFLTLVAHYTFHFFINYQENVSALTEAQRALEQEKSEKALISQQMSNILNLSPLSYTLIGSDGLIHYVNKATRTILGSSDTQGQNIFSFKTVQGTPLEEKLLSASRGMPGILESYRHISASTGVEKNLNISLVPFRKEPENDRYEILMMTTDHTQEKTLLEQVETNFFNVVMGLARALDARDKYTSHHSANVKAYTAMIVYNISLTPEEKKDILIAAELHDIGKIGINDSILHKNGPLSEEEYERMKTHPATGADIFSDIEGYHRISAIIRHHHERVDGRGYPDGLAGDAIPRGSSIIAIADSFDAMTTDRIYRKALSVDEAIEELKRGMGTQFHREYAEIFVRNFKC